MVIVKQYFETTASSVWKAISEPKLMRQWYFKAMPDFKAEVGFETNFIMDSGQNLFSANWKVTKVIPCKELQYIWTYKEYMGEGPVTFLLESKDAGTLLTVIAEGLESFPQDMVEFQESSCREGWEFFIQQELVKFLSKQ